VGVLHNGARRFSEAEDSLDDRDIPEFILKVRAEGNLAFVPQ
jgi:hypothetical protein